MKPNPTHPEAVADAAASSMRRDIVTRIEEIEARLNAATSMPWDCDGLAETGHTHLSLYEGTNKGRIIATGITCHEDADLLFNAPIDLAHLLAELKKIRTLATIFTGEVDPDYKDQWETGHDSGMATAGRQLGNLLDSIGVPK